MAHKSGPDWPVLTYVGEILPSGGIVCASGVVIESGSVLIARSNFFDARRFGWKRSDEDPQSSLYVLVTR